jgi:hypothetical protein
MDVGGDGNLLIQLHEVLEGKIDGLFDLAWIRSFHRSRGKSQAFRPYPDFWNSLWPGGRRGLPSVSVRRPRPVARTTQRMNCGKAMADDRAGAVRNVRGVMVGFFMVRDSPWLTPAEAAACRLVKPRFGQITKTVRLRPSGQGAPSKPSTNARAGRGPVPAAPLRVQEAGPLRALGGAPHSGQDCSSGFEALGQLTGPRGRRSPGKDRQ